MTPVEPSRVDTSRETQPSRPASSRWRAVAGAYLALMKLRVVELLLITTLPAMVLAERGLPSPGLVAATLVAGTLAGGSAHAFNQVLERDIDAVMHRTRRRPLARAQVPPYHAFAFASLLLAGSTAIMLVWVNALAAALTIAANLFYVLVYTMLLKRRTSQNIVWGGVAGCVPTLIGWAAVTGSLDWPPVLLFLVVFFWTPPHYWPLAMRYREDYVRAEVPMLPAVASATTVATQILAYSWAMVVTTLALWPVGDLGWIFGLLAVVTGAWFLSEAHRLHGRARRDPSGAGLKAMRLFHGSITYLTVVFAGVMADVLILG
ncbi:protoheme IX farnesyltransferase [Haloactinopolyspora alba]|uniref:Protoheme IX farnesyltransferase n=1 Tax=Haloactinopolyspora alba TaxID=648780 RepID=A0A2P8E3I3_9ACTN|nr:heme o synthase [Haloactinopolyspora alba]PSL04038.1 protoheme IX farnesyltransferase [Haloactinopolyspora alba]